MLPEQAYNPKDVYSLGVCGGGGVDRSGCSLCRPGLLWELNTRSTVLGLVGFLGASSDMMSELLEGMSLCKEGIGLLRMIPRRPS